MKNGFRVKPGMTGGLVIPMTIGICLYKPLEKQIPACAGMTGGLVVPMTIGICLYKPLEKQIPGQARNDWWPCHSNDNWNLFVSDVMNGLRLAPA